MTIRETILTCALVLAGSAAFLPAQAAASQTWFVAGSEAVDGGGAQTSQYVLRATFGPAPAAARAIGGVYALDGGFVATLDAPAGPLPWLAAATPRFAKLRSGVAVAVHGTGLLQGIGEALSIGGVPAAILARNQDVVTTTLPPQPEPGWRPVTFSSSAGTATLARGIGILPMIDVDPAPGQATAGALVYRGTPGDAMIWCIANGPSPIVFPLAGLGYGLAIDFATLVPSGLFVVGAPSGELRLPIPPLATAFPVWFQAATLSSDPAYAPGAFTNALRLF